MAVYTRINERDLSFIEKNFNIGKVVSFAGIKKGIAVEIEEVEIVKENVTFKIPGKLN